MCAKSKTWPTKREAKNWSHEATKGHGKQKVRIMDLTRGEITLDAIHKSVESALSNIKSQHKEIADSACDVKQLAELAAHTCEPISDTVRKHAAPSLNALRLMLTLHESAVRAAITGCTRSESISRLGQEAEDAQRNARNAGVCTLPSVFQQQVHIQKQRSPLPLAVRYPPITNVSLSPSASRGSARLASPLRRRTSPPSQPAFADGDDVAVSERHDRLRRFVDDVDRHVRTLQNTLSTFSQRVLVPLQTFCKQQRTSMSKGQQQRANKDRAKENTAEDLDKNPVCDLHQIEFAIVQTLNQIRQLLWPPQDSIDVAIFSNHGVSKKVADLVDCDRFAILRLLPDVLTKFNDVTDKSNFWLKRDVLDTRQAKSGLHRAHRRYIKTERLWQEARQQHRKLLSELEHMIAEVHTNSTRLETLEHDIDIMREDLERSQDQRKTLEITLRRTSENVDHLRARHRALRKRIIMLGTKIEQRDRNYEFMESRVRSQRADLDAMQEKVRISEEYAASLQEKMERFYNSRAAWNKRYLEKSDPEILRNRLQSVQLRIPLPAVREKTFVLKSRLDNLREAFAYIEGGLEDNGVHWTTLCQHLQWPEQVVSNLALPDIKTRAPQASPAPPAKDLTDSDDSSSTSSASSTSAGKSPVRNEWRNAQRIISYVERRYPKEPARQRSFMLRMWLTCNGQQANIEQLIAALQASKVPDVAAYIQRLVR